MTVISVSNIPNSVTSLEELIAWAGYAMRECAPNQAYVEAVGVTNFQADLQESTSPDGQPILIMRFVFEKLPPSAITGKVWNAVKQVPRSAELPAYYLSN